MHMASHRMLSENGSSSGWGLRLAISVLLRIPEAVNPHIGAVSLVQTCPKGDSRNKKAFASYKIGSPTRSHV